MTTPLQYTNLGVLSPKQIQGLWVYSHLSQNVPRQFWETLVDNLASFNPDWSMFKNDIWHVRVGCINYYFQKGLYDLANDTGLGLLGEDFINEMMLPSLTPDQYGEILETIGHITSQGHSTTNIVLPINVPTEKVIVANSDMILYTISDTVEDYLKAITSKRRNSVKKSLALAEGFQYHTYQTMNTKQLMWAVSHTVNNFGDQGGGEDNGFVLESSIHQWALLTNISSHAYFVDVWDNSDRQRKVAMLAFTQRSVPDNVLDCDVLYDFYALALDRKYQGVGSAILLNSISHFTSLLRHNIKTVGVLLNTAPAPGCDYDPYVSYKKNVANASLQVSSGLATHPNRDLESYYSNAYNTKLGEWV